MQQNRTFSLTILMLMAAVVSSMSVVGPVSIAHASMAQFWQADWQDQRYWAKGQYWSYSERYQNGYTDGVQDAQNNSPESCDLSDHTQVYCDGYHAGYVSINNGNQEQQAQSQGQGQGQTIINKIIINNNNSNNNSNVNNSTGQGTGGTSGDGNQP